MSAVTQIEVANVGKMLVDSVACDPDRGWKGKCLAEGYTLLPLCCFVYELDADLRE